MSRPFSSSNSTLQTTRGSRGAPRPARTAPPCESRRNTQIPVEKFLDVLQNSEYYAEMYPGILPLTRKIYRQHRERVASGGTSLKWTESRGLMGKTAAEWRTTRDQLLVAMASHNLEQRNVQTTVEDCVASQSPESPGGFQDSKHWHVRSCESATRNNRRSSIDSEETNVMDMTSIRGTWTTL